MNTGRFCPFCYLMSYFLSYVLCSGGKGPPRFSRVLCRTVRNLYLNSFKKVGLSLSLIIYFHLSVTDTTVDLDGDDFKLKSE